MTVRVETATVYFGGRRRWFSLDAACRAEAKLRFKKEDDDSDEGFDERVPKLAAEARAEFNSAAAAAPPTEEAKALAACRVLVRAKKEVMRLSDVIGGALGECAEAWGKEAAPEDWETFAPYTSHLAQAYEFSEGDDGDREYLSESEKLKVLAACPHCLAAHNAIQERKAARRRLAAARRAITMIGKS